MMSSIKEMAYVYAQFLCEVENETSKDNHPFIELEGEGNIEDIKVWMNAKAFMYENRMIEDEGANRIKLTPEGQYFAKVGPAKYETTQKKK